MIAQSHMDKNSMNRRLHLDYSTIKHDKVDLMKLIDQVAKIA
jgi:hypothetical protein